jgi:hypothetical protein
MMQTTREIDWNFANEYTDKFRGIDFVPTSKTQGPYNKHTYRKIYESVLLHFPEKGKLLEIGTSTGGFVLFCKEQLNDVFFVGTDTRKEVLVNNEGHYNHLTDHFYLGNAYCQKFVDWISSNEYKFDLIVEDGDHNPESQVWVMTNIVDKFLTDNGVFICEDIRSIMDAEAIKNVSPFPENTTIWDGTCSGRSDDICVIVDRRNTSNGVNDERN